MIPISNKPPNSGYNLNPVINFSSIPATGNTIATLISIPVYGADFIIPASNPSGWRGIYVVFYENWNFTPGNTYLVEALFTATEAEYYTLASIEFSASVVAGTNGFVILNGSGTTMSHGATLSARIKFTPIGTPDPIGNCSVIILT